MDYRAYFMTRFVLIELAAMLMATTLAVICFSAGIVMIEHFFKIGYKKSFFVCAAIAAFILGGIVYSILR